MKRPPRSFGGILALVLASLGAGAAERPALVPLPAKVEWTDGAVALGADASVSYAGAEAGAEAETLAAMLRPATGFALPVTAGAAGVIRLALDPALEPRLGAEGYTLAADGGCVRIAAASAAGLFYGGQTLRQLLPPEIHAAAKRANVRWEVPACRIEDRPRFAWRGFMLDYARHFFDVAYTKHLLDTMAAHKLNTFHMHLADDEGWRVEIRKYPKLTEVGAWRGTACAVPNRSGESFERYGGFLTQADLREIVAHAARLHIRVLPEIDLPGHSLALCTAYPETQPTQLPGGGDGRPGPRCNAISPAREANYAMVDDLVGEIAALFPFEYMHIGGDEVNHALWGACPEIRALIEREKLGGPSGAQVYFTKRLEGILARHGKRMIGWNEILNDRLERTTTIMSWTGAGPGFEAARKGFPVVMAPAPHNYFDMGYPDGHEEPPSNSWAGLIDPEKCYAFDPLGGEGLDAAAAARIFGVHACLWAEFITPWKAKSGWVDFRTTGEHADYKAWPRLCALAEVGWTPQALRAYPDFERRMGGDLRRLRLAGVSLRVPPVGATVRKGAILLRPPAGVAEVRYTLDGTDPLDSATAARWNGQPVTCPAAAFRARAFVDGAAGPLRVGARPEPAGAWTKESAGAEFRAQTFDLTGVLDEPGVWRLRFVRTGGAQHLLVRNVELLVNGAAAARDAHEGGTKERGMYRLEAPALPAGARVAVRAELRADSGGKKPDTAGQILLEKAGGLEPAARVVTSIGHYTDHAPANLADYDRGTFFWTDRGVRNGESVTIEFDAAVRLASIESVTGKLEDPSADALPAGRLEVSPDGAAFRTVAAYTNGAARTELDRSPVKAVRITATADSGRFWVIFQDLVLK